MTRFEQLRVRLIDARKAKDTAALGFLSTLVGELQANGKNVDGEKVVSDDQFIATIRKHLKGITEVLSHDPSNEKAIWEKKQLESLLPQQMTEAELSEAIRLIVSDLGDAANMGSVMKELKQRHAGLYDGKLASGLAKSSV